MTKTSEAKFKIGDRVEVRNYPSSYWFGEGIVTACYGDESVIVNFNDGRMGGFSSEYVFSIDNSPIRAVTRREIVPGVYGEVTVERIPFSGFEISYSSYGNAHKLRDAARIFNEIADVLDEQSAEVKKEAA